MRIDKDKSLSADSAELRRHAEELLCAKTAELHPPRTEEAMQRFEHEFEVHQIELELQNAELRRALEELELSRSKYVDLYDFAPVGYFTIDARGLIREVNLAGAQLLGKERRLLSNKPFSRFIAEGDRREFSEHLKSVLQRQGMQKCEIRLTGKDGTVIYGQLQSVSADSDKNEDGCILTSIVDVTIGRQLKEVQDAQEYAENIVETVHEPLVVLTSDLKILTANHCFYATFKVTPEDTIGNFIYDLGNRQWDIPKLRVLFEEILPQNTVFNNYEVEHDFIDIGRKIILLNARQIFRKNIGSRIILLAMEDITDRKRAEEEREQALLQLETVLESIQEGVVISDLDGNILTMNPSALAIHEYESVDQAKHHLYQYQDAFELSDLNGRPVPFDQWPLARVLCGERFTDYEVRVRRKDTGGSWIGSYSGTPVQTSSGVNILSLVTLRDITEYKRAEETLRRHISELEAIFHAFPDFYFWIDADERIIDYKAENIADLYAPPEVFMGKRMQDVLPPDMGEQIHTAIQQVLTKGVPAALEYWLPMRDGNHAFEARMLSLPGNHVLCVVRNITARKRAEEEIERLNTDLAARAAELEDANQELEAFNYTVAHDLRNPLSIISSYTQIVQQLCGSKLNKDCKGYLRDIFEGTHRMSRLINTLLKFSRITHIEIRHDKVYLSSLAQEVVMGLKVSAPERRVTFRIGEGIVADGDAGLLRVVLDNLLSNAWKYSGTHDDGIIEFGTTEVDGKPVYFVRDNGTGFDMAKADNLFTPFKRLPGTEDCSGFGIGLATVDRIVRRHGGRVWAEAEPGKGATFYFTLV